MPTEIDDATLASLATDDCDGATVLAALLEFGEDMDAASRRELVAAATPDAPEVSDP